MVINHKKWRFLLSPWSVLVGVLLGLYIGIYNKALIPYIAPFGTLYLNILKMCILPILITAISTSLGKFMKSNVSVSYIKKMALISFNQKYYSKKI